MQIPTANQLFKNLFIAPSHPTRDRPVAWNVYNESGWHFRALKLLAIFIACHAVHTFPFQSRSVSAEEPFETFLNKHCIACHGPNEEEGDLRFDQLSRDFEAGTDSHHWAEAIDKVNSGEMPPQEKERPNQNEISSFVLNLNSLLKKGRATRMAARSATAHYRLSRREYQNTVYDLLGVRYDPTKPGELNEDTLWQIGRAHV